MFITITEVRKIFKNKSSNFIKGYFDGYNNPSRSKDEVLKVITEDRYKNLNPKAKDFVDGKALGIEDKLKLL